MSDIVRNAIRTPDGTVLESRARWDCATHIDENGKEYMVDGGLYYLRRSAHGDEEDLSVTLNDGHKTVRESLTWGTRGIEGDQELKYIRLCDMETNHVKACLATQRLMHPQIRKAMEDELTWRESNG